jgi:ABC-type multidrug transport system ATPase subunit
VIRVVNLTQHYGIRPVLTNVSLEVKTGELITLLGPNGMGKSTLLAAMAGILSPQQGHVEFNGIRRCSTPEHELSIRRQVAYLPDKPWLPMGHTGREFLLAVAKLYERSPSRAMDQAERLLKLFDLAKQSDWSISSYSAGQQKKIALCAVLITEAPFLLLDEPFSGGLDPAGILALKRVLMRLADDRQVTVVMSTPVPELVEELSHRVAILSDGTILAFDTIEALRSQAGVDAGLDVVLQRLVYPETLTNIDTYFQEEVL